MDDLDRESEVPIYQQIAAWIEARIASGELRARRPIPSEKTIMQAFSVARGTVRRAVEHLRDKGVVYTVPQRGTYVTPPEEHHSLEEDDDSRGRPGI